MKRLSIKKVSIIGAGPFGLFCAFQLIRQNIEVKLYDAMPAPGRKFLIAGHGGLNLTHSENIDLMSKRFGRHHDLFYGLLKDFNNESLRKWCEELGVETFIGTSGRVFPTKLKAADLLLTWIRLLKNSPRFSFHSHHKFKKINEKNELIFENKLSEIVIEKSDFIVFGLGGGSWSKTGSDGKWINSFEALDLDIQKFQPMNCGFELVWSDHFLQNFERQALKNISLTHHDRTIKSELMLTDFGVEGSGIYALSKEILDEILLKGKCDLSLDLKPNMTKKEVELKWNKRKTKDSLKNSLRKTLNIKDYEYKVILELSDRKLLSDPAYLVSQIKSLNLSLLKARPIDEAISTRGGVKFEQLSENLELKSHQNIYFGGEMLDFEAVTGGFLLQACFSQAWRISKNIISKLS